MADPFFFGYGSLVNCNTHSYQHAQPARVSGWRRHWVHTTLREVAYLSVHQVKGQHIDGLIAMVPGGDWAALDLREHAYTRQVLTKAEIAQDHPKVSSVQIYQVEAMHRAAPTPAHPVLLSYLDVVVAGYLEVFGPQGVNDFFASTDGWEAPILDDRAAPLYPRHQPLSGHVRALVDTALKDLAAQVKQR